MCSFFCKVQTYKSIFTNFFVQGQECFIVFVEIRVFSMTKKFVIILYKQEHDWISSYGEQKRK